ncbi:flavin reductase family protein [Variovorax sp. J31P207]|uniref:flavin reductase family protein n=1 Tax=Variovorax sp. J31P207 TaxID=3053510 RepID=UPI0025762ADF|nr:flavin reductase family protein [Variovorax sp. J31P207]MDM0071607.1 flavin reductase family protein [Variovorax sp. J31P207]
MEVNFETLDAYERYKLMASLIVPRPIALVTTLGGDGTVNAAPFSLFNMIGEDPPLVMISINRGPGGALKDTAANILARKEFVVHIADEAIAQAMHDCCAELPPHVSEVEANALRTAPSTAIAPPRIVEAPAAFECVLAEVMETGSRHVFIGRVLYLHARDGLLDIERYHVLHADYFPVGRFGSTLYVRTRERFGLKA